MTADERIACHASRHHGVITLAELRRLGLSRGAIRHRVERGRLHVKHPRVFAVGHPALTLDGIRYAAVAACGPASVSSHRMASALWELRAYSHLEVTSRTVRTGPDGVAVHWTRRLDPQDVTTIRGIPTTSLARTIADLAEIERVDPLSRIIDKASRLDAFDLCDVEATAERVAGRHGARTLRAALGLPSPGLTRSELEDAFIELCRTGGLPLPRMNTNVAAADRLYEADALFADERLIAELDGETHDTPKAFHDDRRRDAALAAAGFQTVRYTDRRIAYETAAVRDELATILRRRMTARAA
jgi:very-short-patch-repair endonuclease